MSAKRRAADADVPLSIEDKAALIEEFAMAIPKTLGPGDDDGIDRGIAADVTRPLGPGDDEPNAKDRGTATEIRGPLAPGETDPADTRPAFRMLAQPAPGPGETFTQRQLTVVPVKDSK